ncbi:MAG: AbrB/MazE/SpoVT family DNA-binding domain-containing protein [Candidatus Bipolaricaulaceae bacterium]
MTKVRKVRLGKKGQLVIPKEIREALGLKEGDALVLALEGRRMVLTAPEEYARSTRGALHGTWGPKEAIAAHLREEREAWNPA